MLQNLRKKSYRLQKETIQFIKHQEEFVSRLICQSSVKDIDLVSLLEVSVQAYLKRTSLITLQLNIHFLHQQDMLLFAKKHILHLSKFTSDRDRQITKKLKCGMPFIECRGGDGVSHKSELKKSVHWRFMGSRKPLQLQEVETDLFTK